MTQPITEASNVITEEIDIASPLDILSLLEKCDQEIFDGFQDYKSLFHKDVLGTIEQVADQIRKTLECPEDGIVVFSGCGTSGRLGFIVARTFNALLKNRVKPRQFHYLLAGGDKALFTSQEAPEDDPYVGVEALQKISTGKTRVIFIGITCGLSAPYVAGQLDYCLSHTDVFIPVLLGFNPAHLARNIKIESWDKTFLNVVQKMESCISREIPCFILNPVVGPEPITGSSRMKSGSATKIVLETICMIAFMKTFHSKPKWNAADYLTIYKRMSQTVYLLKSDISKAVQLSGNSLSEEGNIYYLGNDSLALMGLIDASECPPTYGASLDDVRGFVQHGYETLQNNEGDLSELGRHFRISLDDFNHDIDLSHKDTVILLNGDRSVEMWDKVKSSGCKKVLISFEQIQCEGYDVILNIVQPVHEIASTIGAEAMELSNQMFREIATKWCLNAVTTGAHILKGKVYRNIMIDVKVSNNKLFHRAVGILMKLGNLTVETSTDYLVRSIYDTDDVTSDIRTTTIAKHILQATPKEKVVPVALVSAVLNCSIREAKQMLSDERIIRRSIVKALHNVT